MALLLATETNSCLPQKPTLQSSFSDPNSEQTHHRNHATTATSATAHHRWVFLKRDRERLKTKQCASSILRRELGTGKGHETETAVEGEGAGEDMDLGFGDLDLRY
ncbi:hypothetical protein L1887_31789 [Cichorium endivia]|nr:hypothetical protein L1887_31789 [Cichorium endivia]